MCVCFVMVCGRRLYCRDVHRDHRWQCESGNVLSVCVVTVCVVALTPMCASTCVIVVNSVAVCVVNVWCVSFAGVPTRVCD
mmetsp:Transcript_32013/g.69115  ORF Transcript_32013/g.69115 Transcript_32013/m.69115 type:complete len:81 (+) Transcript_32013:66-308(+)